MASPETTEPAAAAATRAASDGRSILRGTGIVAAGTLLSRVLGAARDSVIAACFPPAVTDTFWVAFTIPNALRGLLAEGAVSAAFVPVYTDLRSREGDAAAREFHRALAGTLFAVLGVVSTLGVILAPVLARLYADGYDEARLETTVTLTRLVFPYLFFAGSAALGMGALNAHRRFAVPAAAPALLNVALIASPFLLVPIARALGLPDVAALALGALVGGALQVVAQWPALSREGLLRAPTFAPGHPGVRRALRLLAPLTIGLGVYQLNVMLSRLFVSYLPAGAQSYLYYGQRLVEIPQGMFALALASATLPALAEMHARRDEAALKETFQRSLRHALFVALPMAALLVACAVPIVAVLFGRGEFSADDVRETGRSLAWQGAGVVAIAAVRVVVPVFHARGDTRTPVAASTANLLGFAGLAWTLRGPMGHAGVALALSAAGAIQLVVLLAALRAALGPLGLRQVAVAALKLTLAAAAAAAAGAGVCRLASFARGDLHAIGVLSAALALAGITYLVACWLLRVPELAEVSAAVRRRR